MNLPLFSKDPQEKTPHHYTILNRTDLRKNSCFTHTNTGTRLTLLHIELMSVQNSRSGRLELRSLQSGCLLVTEAHNLLGGIDIEAGIVFVNPPILSKRE